MKRKNLILLLATALTATSLAACGSDSSSSGEAESEINLGGIVTSSNTSEKSEETEETTQTATEEATEEESHDGMYRSELTNEWIDESIKNQRPVAIMVDNEITALDHYGLTEADVVYELMNSTANNRITRLMCVVKDWGNIEQFGSIRSTRPTNIMLAAEWNAVLVHDGGPYYINEWLAKSYAANFSGGFTRVKNGKATEYTEYVCAGDLESRFASSKYTTEYNSYYEGQHYQFSDTEISISDDVTAVSCSEIALPFPHNSSTLKYNESTGTYDYYEYGKAHIDLQHDNAQLTFKNLLIQNTTFSQLDENGYLIYNAIGQGDGYYITDGTAIDVLWVKSGESNITKYYNKSTGDEITLNTGKTYVALVPSDSWNSVDIK